MCNPVLVMAAFAIAGAAVQKTNNDNVLEAQAKTASDNALANYAANQEQDRQAASQAFEQQTDRVRKTMSQLSLARVLAAEQGGSLSARAFNIESSAAEDYSRIDASLKNTRASIASANAAQARMTASQLDEINVGFKANQMKFFAETASAVGNAYGMNNKQTSQIDMTKNYATVG